ncbi:MAG: methyltransferase domain-containing protein [Planctomycetota bacterium]|nr:methyltransferase domain-containing protein [Planctomycetota bacterium]
MAPSSNAAQRIRYTLWAPVYNLVSWVFRRKRKRSLKLADLKAGERVLIVGAGTGLDLDFIRPGPVLTAIDLTPAMLKRLRRRARRLVLEVDARVMDATTLEFADGSFDVALLHLIVTLVPDANQCLREVSRVLRPGGRAVIFDKFVPDEGPPPLAVRLAAPVARAVFGTRMILRLGPILEGTGLKVVHEEPAGLGGLMKVVLVRKEGAER